MLHKLLKRFGFKCKDGDIIIHDNTVEKHRPKVKRNAKQNKSK